MNLIDCPHKGCTETVTYVFRIPTCPKHGRIEQVTKLPATVLPPMPATGDMTEAEGRAWVIEGRRRWDSLADHLKAGKDRSVWKALGYATFEECCRVEYGISAKRAYQLLGHAEVVEKLNALTAKARPDSDSPVFTASTETMSTQVYKGPLTCDDASLTSRVPAHAREPASITEHEARRIKPRMGEVEDAFAKRVAHGADPVKVVREVAAAAKGRVKPEPAGVQLTFDLDLMERVDLAAASAGITREQWLADVIERALTDEAK